MDSWQNCWDRMKVSWWRFKYSREEASPVMEQTQAATVHEAPESPASPEAPESPASPEESSSQTAGWLNICKFLIRRPVSGFRVM